MLLDVLQALLVPVCFALAGAIGLRVGTPRAVSFGLIGVGLTHVTAIALGALLPELAMWQATAHLLSQCLFMLGFVSLLWVVAVYPTGAATELTVRATAVAAVIATSFPLLGSLAGPTPGVEGGTEYGPVAELLPDVVADLADAPLMVLPVAILVLFVVRFVRADHATRSAMWWPVVGVAAVCFFAVTGTALGSTFPAAGSAAFLIAAPVVPMTMAFGPVAYRLRTLRESLAGRVAELEESRHRLSVASEDERRRLERDLHDGAQQELLALMAQIEVARSTDDPAIRNAALDAAADLSEGAYETVRGISHGVRPAALEDLGLSAAIRELVESVPLQIDLQLDESRPGTLPPDAEAAGLFIVSEGLANAMKHANACRVHVWLRRRGSELEVGVEDDGIGGADPNGSGLRGLADRVEAAGGSFWLDSAPGRTRLIAHFEVGK